MAKRGKEEIIHPRTALTALEGFLNDAGMLLAAARNAHSFLTDDTLDPAKVRKAVAPALKEAIDKAARWYGEAQ